ncbi:MAG TPA: hypothetical protein VGK89_02045 [Candidatus Eisenbacteria bacterium]
MSPGPEPARVQAPPRTLEEIEHRLRWRFVPLLVFAAMMLGLGAVAAISLLAPPRTVAGIPGDADVQAAFARIRGQRPIGLGELRFRSELTGEAEPGIAQPDPAAAAEAQELLARAQARSPADARILTARAHLNLARHMYVHAERRYRRAVVLAPHFGEARLGLGVALALRAEGDADLLEQRALRLQAVAQFAAVAAGDPVHLHALYDRATLLERLGRRAEAERWAREYLRADGRSRWAQSLAARLEPR